MVVLSGPPLHGKSRAARELVEGTNFALLDVDVVRQKYFAADGAGDPAPEKKLHITVQCYKRMMEDAALLLENGHPVVVAGTFSKSEFKAPLLQLMRELRVPTYVHIYTLEMSPAALEGRLKSRKAEGGASPIKTAEQYQWALTLVEPWPFWKRQVQLCDWGRLGLKFNVRSLDTERGVRETVRHIRRDLECCLERLTGHG